MKEIIKIYHYKYGFLGNAININMEQEIRAVDQFDGSCKNELTGRKFIEFEFEQMPKKSYLILSRLMKNNEIKKFIIKAKTKKKKQQKTIKGHIVNISSGFELLLC